MIEFQPTEIETIKNYKKISFDIMKFVRSVSKFCENFGLRLIEIFADFTGRRKKLLKYLKNIFFEKCCEMSKLTIGKFFSIFYRNFVNF